MGRHTIVGLGVLLALGVAYLIGSLPTGYAIARMRGVNVLKVGSGHTGATNVLRSSGAVCAALTVIADVLKGFAGVQAARALVPGVPWVWALAGVTAVLGHNRSVFLKFAGGVGTMTTLGATLAISPTAALLAVIAGAVPMALTRYASLGSLAMAVALPLILALGSMLWRWPLVWTVFGLGAGALSVWELRSNIQRLLRGEERKIGQTITSGAQDVTQD